jgi:hypothetical protein
MHDSDSMANCMHDSDSMANCMHDRDSMANCMHDSDSMANCMHDRDCMANCMHDTFEPRYLLNTVRYTSVIQVSSHVDFIHYTCGSKYIFGRISMYVHLRESFLEYTVRL